MNLTNEQKYRLRQLWKNRFPIISLILGISVACILVSLLTGIFYSLLAWELPCNNYWIFVGILVLIPLSICIHILIWTSSAAKILWQENSKE